MTASVIGQDIQKSGGDQNVRRTAAIVSVKVGSPLDRHLAEQEWAGRLFAHYAPGGRSKEGGTISRR